MANLSNINNKFLVTTAGNVGIGTTSPSAKLEVSGNIKLSTAADIIVFGSGGTSPAWSAPQIARIGSYMTMSDYSGVQFGGYDGTSYGPRMTVLGTGNVGIGTTSPVAKLDITSTTSGSEGLRVDGASGGFAFVVKGGTDYTTHTRAGATIGVNYFTTPPANGLIVEGNVGIGTTSPNYKLDIEGADLIRAYNPSGSASIQIKASANNNSSIDFADPDDTNVGQIIYRHADNSMSFDTNDIEKMRITSAGNVGIGTATPINYTNQTSLTINGTDNSRVDFKVGNAIKAELTASASSFFISHSGDIRMYTAASERMRIDSSGNVGIGTTTPAAKLDVEGGGRFEGNVGIGTAPTSRQLSVFRTTAGSIANFLHYTDSSNFQGLYIQVSQTTDMVTLQSSGASGGGFIFSSGNAEKIRFTATGNVGIGTTTPGQKLEVAGRIRVTTDPTIEFYESSSKRGGIQWSTANDYTNIFAVGGDIRFDIGGEKMRITSGGGISFGSSGTAYGATGEVLTSNGNAAPTWQAAGGGSAWPQEKFAEYTIDSTTSNILVATLNSTTWHGNYLAGCLKFTFSTSDYIQVTYLPVSTFLSAGNKLFFKGTEMTTKNNGSNPATITITFAGNNGSYGSTCTVKLNRNQSISTYTKVNVLIQAISNPNMFILN